ncbi:hypothetical protein N9515_08450 [Vicingaceae bacterium]|nr:hypothetical protein [Vicingaceae bacterium]MDB4061949.1 hypothetical protein [Vicingaceae bacterium]
MNKKKAISAYLLAQGFFIFNFIGIITPIAVTNVLAGFGYKYLLTKQFRNIMISLFTLAIVYGLIHFYLGVNVVYYLRSTAYYFLLFVSSFIGFKYLQANREYLDGVFRFSCISTFALFVIGLALYESEFSSYFWKYHDFVGTGNVFKRYQGLAYEPSHYALIVTPLVIYSFLKLYQDFSIKHVLLFSAVFIPALATISFGFLGAFFIGFLVVITFAYLKYRRIEQFFLLLLFTGTLGSASVMVLNDGLSERVGKIFGGDDTSVNGRTYQAFYLGYKCAAERSLIFGIGAGQIKLIGEDVIRPYYSASDSEGYSKENWPVLALPNATAETLAMYGILGLLLRFGLQFYLFIRMKVYQNYFNLFLFSFMFSYQLMGSFFTSTAEAILWVMCFIPMFPQFKITTKKDGLR